MFHPFFFGLPFICLLWRSKPGIKCFKSENKSEWCSVEQEWLIKLTKKKRKTLYFKKPLSSTLIMSKHPHDPVNNRVSQQVGSAQWDWCETSWVSDLKLKPLQTQAVHWDVILNSSSVCQWCSVYWLCVRLTIGRQTVELLDMLFVSFWPCDKSFNLHKLIKMINALMWTSSVYFYELNIYFIYTCLLESWRNNTFMIMSMWKNSLFLNAGDIQSLPLQSTGRWSPTYQPCHKK